MVFTCTRAVNSATRLCIKFDNGREMNMHNNSGKLKLYTHVRVLKINFIYIHNNMHTNVKMRVRVDNWFGNSTIQYLPIFFKVIAIVQQRI